MFKIVCRAGVPLGPAIVLYALVASCSALNDRYCSKLDPECNVMSLFSSPSIDPPVKAEPDPIPDPVPIPIPLPIVVFSGLGSTARHTCALVRIPSDVRTNVRCWGDGQFGQLGHGNADTIGDNESPSAAGDIDVGGNVIQVAAGIAHTCVLLDTGAVRCWGDNAYGQLGYGNMAPIGLSQAPSTAGEVNVGGIVKQITAGYAHTCALLTTGAVRCWGDGAYGELGYGNLATIGDNEVPAVAGDVPIGGLVAQVEAGYAHTCALLATGNVRCWGDSSYGQLGYASLTTVGDDEAPAVKGDLAIGGSVKRIAVGMYHTCALLTTGTVRCWGDGAYGELGYANINNVGDNETPASAGDVLVGGIVTQIAAGDGHTCAILDSGAVRCWGYGAYGELGYGNANSIGDDETPASAGDVNLGDTATFVIAGRVHSCALTTGGTVRCWGNNTHGQLGYGNTINIGDNETPASAGDVDVGGGVILTIAHHAVLPGLVAGLILCASLIWSRKRKRTQGINQMRRSTDHAPPAVDPEGLPM